MGFDLTWPAKYGVAAWDEEGAKAAAAAKGEAWPSAAPNVPMSTPTGGGSSALGGRVNVTPAIQAMLNRIQSMQPYTPNQSNFGQGSAGAWNESFGRGLATAPGFNAGFDPSQSNATRAQQMALIQQLQAQAAGTAPSIAEAQLRQAAAQNAAQASSAMTGARGMGAGAAERQVGVQRAGIGQELAGQSAITRLQEQMMARSALGQQLAGMRGQDLGQAQIGAGFNLQGQIASRQAQEAALNALMQQAAQAQAGNIAYEQAAGGNRNAWNATVMGALGAGNQANAQANQNMWQWLNALAGAGGSVAGLAGATGGTKSDGSSGPNATYNPMTPPAWENPSPNEWAPYPG